MTASLPDVHSRAAVLEHIRSTMAFYYPRCIDPSGGFYQFFKDDGRVFDRHTRHLVSSTRYVFTFSMAARHLGGEPYLAQARRGVAFLREAHRDPVSGGYAWTLDWQDGKKRVTDANNHCYGLAFVLLAYSHACMAGVTEARAHIDETFALMERHFWNEADGLYGDEASADWSVLAPYRGQNANMHAVEALLAAFDATADLRFLHRAEVIAHNITVRQAALAGGSIWEHYHANWSVDWDYNKDDVSNLFRPWGFQPGHLTEWAKLLLLLERHGAQLRQPADWMVPRAVALFDTALEHAWDRQHGGIHYGFAPDGSVCDGDKYHWVQAESLAAAALLAARTGEMAYWHWYDRLWAYAWQYFVDHRHGAWFRILRADNSAFTDDKSPAGKVDYHNMGACYEVLSVLKH